jgi:hypothetical protein
LPEPGAPRSSRPWPPAAAISSARRAASWPRTSARSGALDARGANDAGGGAQSGALVQRRDHLGERRRELDAHARCERDLAAVLARRDHARAARATECEHLRECAADAAHAPVERQLAEQAEAGERLGRERAGCGQDPDRDRQIETRPRLAQRRRREVHRDAAIRERQPDRGNGGAHAGRTLPHRRLRQPDHVDARQLRADADLDLDRHAVDADQRASHDAGHERLRGNVGEAAPRE